MPINIADPTGGANPAAAAAQSAQGLVEAQRGASATTANARELAQQATGQMLQSGGQVLSESGAMARQSQQLGAQQMSAGISDVQALLKERRMAVLDREKEERALARETDKSRFATYVESSKAISMAEAAFTDEHGNIDPKNKATIDGLRAGLQDSLKGDKVASWGPAVGEIMATVGLAVVSAKRRMAERGDKANELELNIVDILRSDERAGEADAAITAANLGKYQGKDLEKDLRIRVKADMATAAKAKGDEVGAAVDVISAPGVGSMRDGAKQYAKLLLAPEWDREAAADLFRSGKVTEREGVMVRTVLKGIGQKTKAVVAGAEVTEPDTLVERVMAGTKKFGAVNARFMDADVRAADIRATVPEAYSGRAVRLAADVETAIQRVSKQYSVPADRVRAAVQADMQKKNPVKGAPQTPFYGGAKETPVERAAAERGGAQGVVRTPPPGPSSQQPPDDMSVDPFSGAMDLDRTPAEAAGAVNDYVEKKAKTVAFGDLVGDPALAEMFAKAGEQAKTKLFERTREQLDELQGRSKVRNWASAALNWAGIGDLTQLEGRGKASALAQKLDDEQIGVATALALGVREGKIGKDVAIREASKIEREKEAPGLSRFTRALIDDPKLIESPTGQALTAPGRLTAMVAGLPVKAPSSSLVGDMSSEELLRAVRGFKAGGGK